MLFNSPAFLFLFLPAAVAGYFALARIGQQGGRVAIAWLALVSLVFYAWWDVRYVVLLLASVSFNYAFGKALARQAAAGSSSAMLLTLAVGANLIVLGIFKYTDFFIATANAVAGAHVPLLHIVLPLGISFFTFTQIAFLVDAHRGLAREYDFPAYLLFVSYFPHLIAGPILHHREMMPQFYDTSNLRPHASQFAIGLTIFFIGLFKKVVLADGIADFASAPFAASEPLSFFEAWSGVLAYAFQLYFDFSGYSDMAIGLARLFGIKFPVNFDSPYQSASIVEFWRRWHMTLSRFLRAYVYFPLGGNRKGPMRRHVNLMLTMLLGGLWHGAGWTFVLWGGLHGIYLVLNHAWATFRTRHFPKLDTSAHAYRVAAVTLTFLSVAVAWVFFRSPTMDVAVNLLAGMAGLHGVTLPEAMSRYLGPVASWLEAAGVAFTPGGGGRFISCWTGICALAAITFLWPNTQMLMRRYDPALNVERNSTPGTIPDRIARLAWEDNKGWAIALGLVTAAGLLSLNRVSEFLYYQF